MDIPPSMVMVAVPVIVIVVMLALIMLLKRHVRTDVPVVQRPMLTNAEITFHRKLAQAVSAIGGLSIHAQTAMSAFIQPRPGLERDEHMATFRRFSQKRPDFVLVDASWNVRLIVELDDSSHDAGRDAERDALTRAAGIRTVRFVGARKITVTEIETRIRNALDV